MPLPKHKPSRPAPSTRRTDPYQAPFFFPTPMSPQAGTYFQEVLNERKGLGPLVDGIVVSEHREVTSPTSSPVSLQQALPDQAATAAETESVTPNPDLLSAEDSHSTARHRWSWHFPLRPRLPDRTRSVDAPRRAPEKTDSSEHKDGFSKFKFGHHRR